MKKILFLAIGGLLSLSLNAQSVDQQVKTIQSGDTLILGEASADGYTHLDFPKANFIIKQGGIVDYKSLEGQPVVVRKVINPGVLSASAIVERADGKKFFGVRPSVKVALREAMTSGEITAQ
ncbi:hypothetical protein [Croceiramulus getboli]|nr:hypothetical protein P8624_13225 [Flavobacteriaceae bacterium YJPT1-3]